MLMWPVLPLSEPLSCSSSHLLSLPASSRPQRKEHFRTAPPRENESSVISSDRSQKNEYLGGRNTVLEKTEGNFWKCTLIWVVDTWVST